MAYGPSTQSVVGFCSGGSPERTPSEPKGTHDEQPLQVADLPDRDVPVRAGQLQPRADGRTALVTDTRSSTLRPAGAGLASTLERSSAQTAALGFPGRASGAIASGGPATRFAAMPSLPEIGSGLPEVVLRTAIVYLFVVAALRLSGKREVGQMSVLELVVILVISDAVQNSMVGENTSIWGGLVAVATLLALDFGLKALARRSRGCARRSRASRACSSVTGDCSEGDPGGGARDRGGARGGPLARPRPHRGRPARRARDRRLDQRDPA